MDRKTDGQTAIDLRQTDGWIEINGQMEGDGQNNRLIERQVDRKTAIKKRQTDEWIEIDGQKDIWIDSNG